MPRIHVELATSQKALLWDWLKEHVKRIVVEEEQVIHYGDYLTLIETLEYDMID